MTTPECRFVSHADYSTDADHSADAGSSVGFPYATRQTNAGTYSSNFVAMRLNDDADSNVSYSFGPKATTKSTQ